MKHPFQYSKERYNICIACEYFNPSKKRCMKCGCLISLKVNYPGSKCPIKKW